jgi:MFS family permease
MSPALACLVVATFFHFASLYYLFPTLPLYVRHLGGTTSDVGLIIGILALTSLAARPFLGVWMDRAGRRVFLLTGAGIYALASLGYWVIRSVPGLLLWRVFHGIGLATFSTAAAALAADLAPPGRRGATMGVFGLAQAAALTVGPGIGQVILRAAGYPGLFVGAASTALASLVFGLALPAIPFQRSDDAPEPGSRAWPIRDTAGASAALQFAASVAYGTIISFIAVVARDRGLETVGVFFALLALSSLGIRVAAGRAYDAWGAAAVLTPLLLALAIGMTLLAMAGGPWLFLLAAVLAGLGIGGTHTTLQARVVDRALPERRARAVAGFAACWELGVGGGTILMGRLAEILGFEGMFLVVAGLPLVGLGGLQWLGDPRRRDRGGERESGPRRGTTGCPDDAPSGDAAGGGTAAQPPK